MSPSRRRQCIDHVRDRRGVSERRACRVLGQHRSAQRHIPRGRGDEDRLLADMIELARRYGRYGYRRIATLLRDAGWQVNDKRVERLWRREGLKVPGKQPKRGRLWLNDGSCVRLRAARADHVWSYDFVHHRTHDGRVFRTLNVLDEFTRESLSIRVRRKLSSVDVIDVLTELFILRGIPAYIRSDNGPEFVAGAVRQWIAAVGARTAFIEPGSPWENGCIESFNARLRDELLNGEIFYTLKEAQVLIESWRRHYNAIRPHSSLGYRPPAPETIVMPSWPPGSAPPTIQLGRETVNALTFKPDQSTGAGQGRQAARMTPFKWVNTTLGNIKRAITGTYRKLGPDHARRYLASFAWRYNRRYQLQTMIPRFVHSAARNQPMPYRLLIAGCDLHG